ncbi:MAG: methyl-accepting chemotaxis protein, partial [Bradyrhizobium sp.]|nr:methyl-accepting chemotaxis protein [Bradyrhizobium sp.]
MVLVAGMLANQIIGNQSIEQSSKLVVINTANRANAQAAEAAMLRAQISAQDIGSVAAPDRLQASLQALQDHLAAAAKEVDA